MSRSRISFALFYGLAMAFLMPFTLAADPDSLRVKIFDDDPVALIRNLEQSNYDVAGINRPEGYVEAILTPREFETLKQQGFKLEVVESYAGKTLTGVPSGYRHFNDIVPILNNFETSYPDIAKVVDLGTETGVGTTVEERTLYAVKLSDNVGDDEDEPNVYIVGCHHAREIMTPEFCIWAIEKLTTLYGTDADVTKWLDTYQIYLCPVANPDGHVYCFDVFEWWRKNRRNNGGGAYGVDLNRNFDFNWYGPYSGSTDPWSDTYKGPSPNSEQETKMEVAFAEERHLAKVLDFHSSGSEVLYTYILSSSFPALMENWFEDKAIELSYALNYGGYYRKPSAEGEHYEWELCKLGAFSFLVETGYEFQPYYSTAQSEFNDHIWPGIQWFLDHEISLRGHVIEAVSGNPLEANIAIKGVNYTQGEIRKSEPKFGRYHYFLPPGNHEVTFSAAGFSPRTFDVNIIDGKSTLLEVQLGPGPTLTVNGPASQDNVVDLSFDYSGGPGQGYLNGISLGTDGFTFKNGLHVPLTWDFLYHLTVGVLPGWLGYLDGAGHAEATLFVPRDPLLVGFTVFMGYFTLDATTHEPKAASAAVNITIDA
ncbi:MAG: M14 family zinc carboxypeptidase [Planctomycetota bacterium]|jgi:hypothetical protein